jgi:hypothetical protein
MIWKNFGRDVGIRHSMQVGEEKIEDVPKSKHPYTPSVYYDKYALGRQGFVGRL